MEACWECGTVGEVHHHHPVPKSRGGTRTIPLCLLCHGKAHGRRMSTSQLTKDAMRALQARGVRLGNQHYGDTAEERAIIDAAVELRASGRTFKQVSADLATRGMFARSGKPFGVSTLHNIIKRETMLIAR